MGRNLEAFVNNVDPTHIEDPPFVPVLLELSAVRNRNTRDIASHLFLHPVRSEPFRGSVCVVDIHYYESACTKRLSSERILMELATMGQRTIVCRRWNAGCYSCGSFCFPHPMWYKATYASRQI
jgi:hypothetical protein